jgi:predicted secreted hydrolase
MIFESRLISATNTDVLSVGRLNSIPYNGQLTLRFLADLGDVTNNYSLTLQKPNGDVPVDGQLVNVSGAGTDGTMKDDEVMQFTFSATQGGHFVVSLTENGTATCMFQAILRP